MNVGLLYTPVSIYQMTRGALVLFVGTLSVLFLRRRLWLYQFSHHILSLNIIILTPPLVFVPQVGIPHSGHGRRGLGGL